MMISSLYSASSPRLDSATLPYPVNTSRDEVENLHPIAQPIYTQHQSNFTLQSYAQTRRHGSHNPRWEQVAGLDAQIKTLSQQGQVGPALDALSLAIHQVSLSSIEIACHFLLTSCEKKKSLQQALHLHAHLASYGLDSSCSLGEHLVFTYVRCCCLQHAFRVFHMLPHRTAFSWTAIINAHLDANEGCLALEIYDLMRRDGVEPSKFTFINLLKACHGISGLANGGALHVDARNRGLSCDPYLGSALMKMYGRCGDIRAAEDVFHELSERDLISWSIFLTSTLEHGYPEKVLLSCRQMHEEGLKADQQLIMVALQACCMLAEKEKSVSNNGRILKVKAWDMGRALHIDLVRSGVRINLFVGSTLVSMYSKCGDIMGAESVFDSLPQRDVISWTVILSAYVEEGRGEDTLRLFCQMQRDGVRPDEQAYVSALQACSMLAEAEEGQHGKPEAMKIGQGLHSDAQRMGFDSDLFVGSSLIAMYGKCGNIGEAEKVFCELPSRDRVVWNAMLSAYVDQGEGEKALHLYQQMQEEGMDFDLCTIVITMQACCVNADEEQEVVVDGQPKKATSLEIGMALHRDAENNGFDLCVFAGSALISMYSRCGVVVEAENVFNNMAERDSVSWNAMLTAYVDHGLGAKALQLYDRMLESCVPIDDTTLVCVLQACSQTGSIKICKDIHFAITSSHSSLSLHMATALVHAYGSCSCMADAQAVFGKVAKHDVASWNAFISGFARGGNCAETLEVFETMLQLGGKPNELTFLPVLGVCTHAGLVDQGMAYFESMSRDYGIIPKVEHYASVLDLLVRSGDLAKVADMLSKMPVKPDLAMWICLLGACQKYQSVELGKYAFDNVVHLQPKETSAYILMANIYADANMHECVREVENARRREGV